MGDTGNFDRLPLSLTPPHPTRDALSLSLLGLRTLLCPAMPPWARKEPGSIRLTGGSQGPCCDLQGLCSQPPPPAQAGPGWTPQTSCPADQTPGSLVAPGAAQRGWGGLQRPLGFQLERWERKAFTDRHTLGSRPGTEAKNSHAKVRLQSVTGCSSAVSLRLPSFLLQPLSPSSSYPLCTSVSPSLCLSLSLPCLSASLNLAVSAPAPRLVPLWCLLLPVQTRLSPSLSLFFSLFFSVLMVFLCVKSLLSSTRSFSRILSAAPHPCPIQQETCPQDPLMETGRPLGSPLGTGKPALWWGNGRWALTSESVPLLPRQTI